jgi:hypothetical protein
MMTAAAIVAAVVVIMTSSTTQIVYAQTPPPPLFNSAAPTASTNTTLLLYDNPNSGIQIRYPKEWAYIDSGTFLPGESFTAVIFMPARDALQFGTMMMPPQQESSTSASTTSEMPLPSTSVTALTLQLPFANMDVRLLVDYILSSTAPEDRDYELISTNSSAILSGMPAYAYEAVTLPTELGENRTKWFVVMTIQGDRAYAVAYGSQESTFEQFLPIARDMISSFTITEDDRRR